MRLQYLECLDHRLTTLAANAAPIADDQGATKYRRLDGQAVEPVHVDGRVDAAQVNVICWRFHAPEIGSQEPQVQRQIESIAVG